MAPILKYPGAKWRLSDWIISHMPPHEAYLEPFCGSCAVLFNKAPARIETINDIDSSITGFFRVCREQPDELARVLSLTPWARDEYDLAEPFEPGQVSDLEGARQFAVRSWMAFGSCMSEKTGWRHSTGKKKNTGPDNPCLWARLPDMVKEVAARLLMVQIENRPAIEVIRRWNGDNVLIYADPPYVLHTRTAHKNQYRYEMADEEHTALLQALTESEAMVMVSGYDCELYNDLLHGWRKEVQITQAEQGVTRKECLWINPYAQESSAQQRMLF